LIRSARSCFERSGYSGTTVGAISAAAGVAHGTFYVHFANKDALLDELLAGFNERLAEKLEPILVGRELPSAVRVTAEIFLDHWAAERWLVECLAQRAARGVEIGELLEGINPPMVQLLGAAFATFPALAALDELERELVVHGLLALWLRVGLRFTLAAAPSRRQTCELLSALSVGAVAGLAAGREGGGRP